MATGMKLPLSPLAGLIVISLCTISPGRTTSSANSKGATSLLGPTYTLAVLLAKMSKPMITINKLRFTKLSNHTGKHLSNFIFIDSVFYTLN